MVHQYANGWQAARADGWCIQCLRQAALPNGSMCESCQDKRNVRGRNRNAARPTQRRVRKYLQDALLRKE